MFFLGWIIFSVAIGMFASVRRNRNGIGWFFIALLISPLAAFVMLIILLPREPLIEIPYSYYRRPISDGGISDAMMTAIFVLAVVILSLGIITIAMAQQQTFRDASGRTVSTATQSGNQTTYRDASGRSIGTATTDSAGDTVLRNAAGRSIGTINGRR